MECAGITDVLTKSMGSATAVNVVRATVDALKKLEEPEEIAARRGMSLEEVARTRCCVLAPKASPRPARLVKRLRPRLLRRTVSDD